MTLLQVTFLLVVDEKLVIIKLHGVVRDGSN